MTDHDSRGIDFGSEGYRAAVARTVDMHDSPRYRVVVGLRRLTRH